MTARLLVATALLAIACSLSAMAIGCGSDIEDTESTEQGLVAKLPSDAMLAVEAVLVPEDAGVTGDADAARDADAADVLDGDAAGCDANVCAKSTWPPGACGCIAVAPECIPAYLTGEACLDGGSGSDTSDDVAFDVTLDTPTLDVITADQTTSEAATGDASRDGTLSDVQDDRTVDEGGSAESGDDDAGEDADDDACSEGIEGLNADLLGGGGCARTCKVSCTASFTTTNAHPAGGFDLNSDVRFFAWDCPVNSQDGVCPKCYPNGAGGPCYSCYIDGTNSVSTTVGSCIHQALTSQAQLVWSCSAPGGGPLAAACNVNNAFVAKLQFTMTSTITSMGIANIETGVAGTTERSSVTANPTDNYSVTMTSAATAGPAITGTLSYALSGSGSVADNTAYQINVGGTGSGTAGVNVNADPAQPGAFNGSGTGSLTGNLQHSGSKTVNWNLAPPSWNGTAIVTNTALSQLLTWTPSGQIANYNTLLNDHGISAFLSFVPVAGDEIYPSLYAKVNAVGCQQEQVQTANVYCGSNCTVALTCSYIQNGVTVDTVTGTASGGAGAVCNFPARDAYNPQGCPAVPNP